MLVTTLLIVACGTSHPPAAAPGHHSGHGASAAEPGATAAPVKAPGEAQIGDRTTCPVSGEAFVVTAGSPKHEHSGRTYYLCCAHCVDRFAADPDKYLHKPGA